MPNSHSIAFLALLLVATAAAAEAPRSPTPTSETGVFKVTTFAEGLEHGWGLVQLPDGRMLVSERPGRVRYIDKNGKLSPALTGLPKVWANGQGGLLDLELSPQFDQDHLVYFSFSEPGDAGSAGTAVARGKLTEKALEDVQVIWRQTPKVKSPNHFGSRLVFRPDGTLFITMGDRYNQRDKVQDLSTTIGKTVRVRADGTPPPDNPFVDRQGALPEIWSYGHRSVQAATLRPGTSELWTVEHGARGGDELNNPQAGRNYGWPVITYGIDYSGVKIGEGTEKAGMEQPVYYWDPVIAPSGALFYTGKVFTHWQGDLFVGSMQPGCLVRLDLENARVVKETRYLGELKERIRDVLQGSDGLLYLLTDASKGRVIRLGKGERNDHGVSRRMLSKVWSRFRSAPRHLPKAAEPLRPFQAIAIYRGVNAATSRAGSTSTASWRRTLPRCRCRAARCGKLRCHCYLKYRDRRGDARRLVDFGLPTRMFDGRERRAGVGRRSRTTVRGCPATPPSPPAGGENLSSRLGGVVTPADLPPPPPPPQAANAIVEVVSAISAPRRIQLATADFRISRPLSVCRRTEARAA